MDYKNPFEKEIPCIDKLIKYMMYTFLNENACLKLIFRRAKAIHCKNIFESHYTKHFYF